MMMRALSLVGLFTLACAGPAAADVLHLRNGGKLEGKVLKQGKHRIVIQLRAGKMSVPRSRIKRVEKAMSAKREFGLRKEAVNAKSPVELDKLAEWASKRGLGKEARDLRAQALGIRLEKKVVRAKKKGTVQAYLDLYGWARGADASPEVQLYLIELAAAVRKNDPKVRRAFAQLERDLARQTAWLKKLEELAKRPQYVMPKSKKAKRAGGGSFGAMLSGPDKKRRAMLQRLARFAASARARAGKRTRSKTDPRDEKLKKKARRARRAKRARRARRR